MCPQRNQTVGEAHRGRPATGSIQEVTLSDGTTAFQLRFRANGRRERDVLHERRACTCGCGGGWTIATARAELGNILARVTAGVWQPRTSAPRAAAHGPLAAVPTFHEYASEWLSLKVTGAIGDHPIDATTEADYLWRLSNHLLPFFGRDQLDQIDRRRCEAFKAFKLKEAADLRAAIAAGADIRDPRSDRRGRPRNRRTQPLSLASIKKLIDLLAAILEDAIEDDIIDTNPARSKRMRVRVPKPTRTFLEMDELVAVVDAAGRQDSPLTVSVPVTPAGRTAARVAELLRGGMRPSAIAAELELSKATVTYHVQRLAVDAPGAYIGRRAIVATLGYSGPRVSELCDMKIGHVRIHDGQGARFRIPDAKTEAGVRIVEMSADLVEEWTLHIDRLRRAGHPTGPADWAFPNARGGQLTRGRVAEIVRDAAKHASTDMMGRGLPPLPHTTPHSLRRTYISIALLANQFDVKWVMDQVGHDDSTMTMDVYAQLQQRHKRDHGAEFDRLVRAARERLHGDADQLTLDEITEPA
jgi:integrase